MLKPKQVPKEVIAAFREALKRDDTSFEADFCTALNAWPGMGRFEDETGWDVHIELPLLVTLPLTQEASDDQ